MKTIVNAIRGLSFRKLMLVVVLTDVMLAGLAVVMLTDACWFAQANADTRDLEDSKQGTLIRHSAPAPAPSLEENQSKPIGGMTVFIATMIALAIVLPCVLVARFFVLLRRHIERLEALIHARNAGHETPTIVPRDEYRVSESTVPTKEEPRGMQGGALFDRLFEDTLELQVQIEGA